MQNKSGLAALPPAAPTVASFAAPATRRHGAGQIALSQRAKAAIVVRFLLNNGAELPIENLPDDLQAVLTQQMGDMRMVDKATLDAVIHEFQATLDSVGLSFPKGLIGAISALDGKISPQTAARLRKEAGVREIGDPWERVRELQTEKLMTIIERESTEVAAVMLSKLPTVKAAELLGKLSGPLARRITYAVSQTGNVTPDAVYRIGLSLATQMDLQPVLAFDKGPGERVGAILNESMASTREDVLTSLDETDEEFAGDVRRNIFTFELIPDRVAPRDIATIVRQVDNDQLLVALAGATKDPDVAARDYILSNLSGRLADNMRDEMENKGKVKPKDAEAAMGDVVKTIREMIDNGEIEMLEASQEDEEEDAN